MAYMELVENYENLVKSMVPMECMEPVINGVWDTTLIISETKRTDKDKRKGFVMLACKNQFLLSLKVARIEPPPRK